MDGWVWLVLTMAVPLASSMAGVEITATTDIPAATELQPTDVPATTAPSTTAQSITTEQSIATVTPDPTASPVLTTTDFTQPDTTVSQTTDTTSNPITDQMITTHHSPITTIASDANTTTPHTNTTNYSTTANITTYSTAITIPSANTTHFISPTIPITTANTTTTTIIPTTVTPPTTTALKCENGGENVNDVCICPDEWTGKTCSEKNFCKEDQIGGFRFPRTPIGWFAYSEEKCETGSATGKPRASTRCLSMNGSPAFSPPQIFQCDLTLSDIQQNLTSPADLEMLATSTQILTSKPEELTAENVTAAAEITNTLLLSANSTESVRVAAVATVSQLLNAKVPDDTKENNATLRLTVTLDQLSVNLSLSQNTSQSQVVQPNLVVQSAQIPAVDTQGVQFTSLRGISGNFLPNRIHLNTNATQVVVENSFIADALIYVRFPPAEGVRSRQTDSNVSLGFVLYQNDRFFRSKLYMSRRATIRVLSASIRGQEPNMEPQHVEMMFRPRLINGTSLYDFSCVFWNYSQKDWSTSGCSKGNTSDGLMRCFCNHTTNFAALWSFSETFDHYAEALGVISTVGLSLSFLGLIVTIIYNVREIFQNEETSSQNAGDRNLISMRSQLCIYISLLAFIITFVSGVQNSSRQIDVAVQTDDRTNDILDSDERIEPDRGSCTAVVALLHFLLMSTFMWNSVNSTQILLWKIHLSVPPHWTLLSMALGWGVPALFMAITLGVTYRVDSPLGYRQEEFCWLAALDKNKHFSFEKPLFWGFLLPVSLILIYNIVLLFYFSSKVRQELTFLFLSSFTLVLLLGVSWVFGYLVLVTSGTVNLTFSILFCLCTTTQGFQMFIATAITQEFRDDVSRSVQYLSSVSISFKKVKYRLWKNWDMDHSEKYRER
ncbi:adhesion G-protein coupled receptor G7-like [Astatotilapia calliptera]|uniref:adhesion G-protein coupled receptor G7-like n=1 Tax=Astatotilapia calliptera TaxID=8154 RepID=UPI000E3F9E2E|nr:adhesion G-protein coupled receptor G7-like [Astatotilapia calliptera]